MYACRGGLSYGQQHRAASVEHEHPQKEKKKFKLFVLMSSTMLVLVQRCGGGADGGRTKCRIVTSDSRSVGRFRQPKHLC